MFTVARWFVCVVLFVVFDLGLGWFGFWVGFVGACLLFYLLFML